ncbi:non-lysosomal glucosylceramidase [Microbacterium sp. KUDC0406]|uniref:GH116 family glycosyl-hydrolase n=1 Tax=Microbacterium sp. KUDC0406 TaxID=2909588 RepID=UPI001F471112|nr:GH116 family glycosyl-hydrolase [Microbacterium sp. KUDC0406]UJP09756.1 non-lysosomal glucosylceramidase [Microbacterium sp. KUDC0406]
MTRRARPIPHTAERAAFLLGGIGTGNVSLGARGELRDWEFENLPDKGRRNPRSFFAIHAAPEGGDAVTRVLEARDTGRRDYDAGYSFDDLAGLPRLAGATMYGEYPVVDIDFTDDVLPVEVSLRAFTPLVPLDADASGIPAAVLRYRVTNPGSVPVTVTVAGSVTHTAGRGAPGPDAPWGIRGMQTVRRRDEDGVHGLDFGIDLPADDAGYGTLSLTTTDDSVTVKPQWVTSYWPDGARMFWSDFAGDGLLEPEPRLTLEDKPRGLFAERDADPDAPPLTEEEMLARLPRLRTGSLGIVHTLGPGESRDFEFVLAWSFPNRIRGWRGHIIMDDPHADEIVHNHYATLWPDAWSAAAHLHVELPSLEAATDAFVETLYGGTLDPVLADAAGANIAALRSTTCFVVESPTPELGEGPVFAAWEGSFDHGGSCEGTCTHVWSYAQTAAWLFPSLERSARRAEFLLETDADGAQRFRGNRIFGSPSWFMGPAVDGQLGTFLRLHREWRFSGDDDFLRELWPAAVRSLEYATREWDRDGDGLLDGELHNTYDIEFHGIDPLANGMYLAALRAGARMAAHLGETKRAEEWRARSVQVAAAMDSTLWNGEYYRQVIEDADAHRYQYGDGVLSDQLLGQFHAYLNGLGPLLPEEHVQSALGAIVRHNHRDDLTAHESTQRVYALNDEGGLLLASWPNGGRPAIPFVYSDEVWTGIEHQVAASLLFAGRADDALRIERALRARYDGVHRNPWNEIECGNHYARSLASWALLIAASGAQWDAPTRTLSFDPVGPSTGSGTQTPWVAEPVEASFLFTTGTGWGRARIDGDTITLHLIGGELALDELLLRGRSAGTGIRLDAGGTHTARATH